DEPRARKLAWAGLGVMALSLPLEVIGGRLESISARLLRVETTLEETAELMGATLLLVGFLTALALPGRPIELLGASRRRRLLPLTRGMSDCLCALVWSTDWAANFRRFVALILVSKEPVCLQPVEYVDSCRVVSLAVRLALAHVSPWLNGFEVRKGGDPAELK